MNVTVFSDIKAENFLSMDIYAEQLKTALKRLEVTGLAAKEFTVTLPQLPHSLRKLSLFVGRYLKYPWLMQSVKGQINHISDHSYGFLTYFLPSRSCVVTCHDLAPLLVQSSSSQVWLKKGLWKIALRGTLRAAQVIAVSEYTRRDLLKYTNYPPQRIQVIYSGVEARFAWLRGTAQQCEWEAAFRARYKLGQAKIILHVGRYSPRKNFEGVLRVFAVLRVKLADRVENMPVHLVQIGGQFTDQHYNLIDELGIANAVTQINYLPMEELPRAYNLAAALLFPSYYEGFGWPPLEAMACGAPVVASNVTAIPEVVGDAALTFNPDDTEGMATALYQLLTDQELYCEMVERGLKRAAEFSWQRCAKQVYAVYQKILTENAD